MKVELDQVKLRGAGVSIQNERVLLVSTFSAILSGKLAKQLGLYGALYKDNGEGPTALRSFKSHKATFGFETAELTIYQDMQADPVTLQADVKGFEATQNDDGADLRFRVLCPLDSPEMVYFVMNQRREPAPKLIINGRQKEFVFSAGDEDGAPPEQQSLPVEEPSAEETE